MNWWRLNGSGPGERSQPARHTMGKRIHKSFSGSLRDELLNRETFSTWAEAKILIEAWGQHSKTLRPHNSLG